MEDLRQMCVYKYAYEQKDDRMMFWDYIKSIH